MRGRDMRGRDMRGRDMRGLGLGSGGPYSMTALTVKPWKARHTCFLPGLDAGASALEVG